MRSIYAISALLLLLCLSTLIYQALGRLILRYSLDDDALYVTLLGMRIVKVPFDRIVDARRMTLAQAAIFNIFHPYRTLAFGNKLNGDVVLIHRRAWWLRWILITPADGDRFVRMIMEQVSKRRGGSQRVQLPESELP